MLRILEALLNLDGSSSPSWALMPTMRRSSTAVNVIAFCSSTVDHVVTALLTAAIMNLTGGAANAELAANQVATVGGCPASSR
ncbi:hypothetical protein J8N05_18995 [Streptomyces sp. BH-SS-21]|uniref:Uncharacterized protein n=1 Tax=Streptomyces liliiviolaceus TaxID=2823109 RepID=A0A940XWM2_9ACTN|nr:DUF6368 family protein [Streptomyces liliiviolaceus]MBQ0850278.1 hypothetical protein [Streptomyces liliiviolaceus]